MPVLNTAYGNSCRNKLIYTLLAIHVLWGRRPYFSCLLSQPKLWYFQYIFTRQLSSGPHPRILTTSRSYNEYVAELGFFLRWIWFQVNCKYSQRWMDHYPVSHSEFHILRRCVLNFAKTNLMGGKNFKNEQSLSHKILRGNQEIRIAWPEKKTYGQRKM